MTKLLRNFPSQCRLLQAPTTTPQLHRRHFYRCCFGQRKGAEEHPGATVARTSPRFLEGLALYPASLRAAATACGCVSTGCCCSWQWCCPPRSNFQNSCGAPVLAASSTTFDGAAHCWSWSTAKMLMKKGWNPSKSPQRLRQPAWIFPPFGSTNDDETTGPSLGH